MVIKKLRFGKEEIFTTIIEDIDGKVLGKWKVNKSDYPEVLWIISKQFGLPIKIIKKDYNKIDRDLDWALK